MLKLKYRYFSVVVFLSIITACWLVFCFVRYALVKPVDRDAAEQTFIIEKNDSLKNIAISLEEAGLVRNRFIFAGYIYYKGWAGKLQAGEYSLSPSLNTLEVARKIVTGDIAPNEVKITIPEGFSLKQIDARLANAGLIEEGELIRKSNLEGYLFPDTYQFDRYASLENIISKMQDNFDQKVDEELLGEIKRQGKTLDDIIIMASIIEKEVKEYNDRQIVSGIFWRRVNSAYPLQSCATIAYALGVDKWRYSLDDLEINSAYNTYKNIGLPPGPICNPGLEAIKAAIYPVKTSYNFFLTEPDNGQTIFSRTAEEHEQNKVKYLR